MNKQELIEKIENLNKLYGEGRNYVAVDAVLELVEQLDEPKKVVLPQFVADWLSNLKSGLFGLNYDSVSSEIYDWVYDTEDNLGKLHLAFVYGYEVEKEKKYKVVLLNYNDGHLNLVNVRTLGENIIFFTKKTQFDPRSLKLTKAEIISSGFGWVFDCPGIEIEEVKD